MRTPDQNPSTLCWHKSSYSNANGGNCVEVATGLAGLVPVRDSKDPEGPNLTFTAASWAAFLAAVRAREFTP